MNDKTISALIEESRELESIASSIQQGQEIAQSDDYIKSFIDQYQEWYANSLALLPSDIIDTFREQYDKKAHAFDLLSKIKDFLSGMTRKNVMFDQAKSSIFPYWTVPYETVFLPRLQAQRQVLLEAERRIPPKVLPAPIFYVEPSRIDEIRTLPSPSFDMARLVRLCEEINACYQQECYMAVGMILRSIVDHVPPIFGKKNFDEVANNYSGTKSFKESISSLQSSMRKIADSFLHTHIRQKEVLPTKVQVNFSPDLDVLLAEIVRISKP